MMNEAAMKQLQQDEDMAYFRANLCLYSPESYTLEEKRQICEDIAICLTVHVLPAFRLMRRAETNNARPFTGTGIVDARHKVRLLQGLQIPAASGVIGADASAIRSR